MHVSTVCFYLMEMTFVGPVAVSKWVSV